VRIDIKALSVISDQRSGGDSSGEWLVAGKRQDIGRSLALLGMTKIAVARGEWREKEGRGSGRWR
jgi:hypothetical protein